MTTEDLKQVFRLATGFWESGVLFALVELDLFSILTLGPASSSDLAQKKDLDPQGVSLLLDAAIDLGLLEREGSQYRLTDLSKSALVPGAPEDLSKAILMQKDTYAIWGTLAKTVQNRLSASSVPPLPDSAQTRHFVMGMHARISGMASSWMKACDLSQVSRIMDVGAGPCTYSLLFLERYPTLRALALDRPEILDVAREIHSASPALDRLIFQPFDLEKDPVPQRCDAALYSGVLHRFDDDTCLRILRETREALKPPGLLILHDIFISDHTRLFSRLFAINMYLLSPGSVIHSVTRMREILNEAGFTIRLEQSQPPPTPHTLIIADLGGEVGEE